MNVFFFYVPRDETSKEGLDYAKLMEPAKVRKRRYFSLAVVCFTAFILALSVSIVMTSAKPYLDLLSSFITFLKQVFFSGFDLHIHLSLSPNS